jgi:hypothetical protein
MQAQALGSGIIPGQQQHLTLTSNDATAAAERCLLPLLMLLLSTAAQYLISHRHLFIQQKPLACAEHTQWP